MSPPHDRRADAEPDLIVIGGRPAGAGTAALVHRAPELPLFDPARLFPSPRASAGRHAA